MEKVRKDDLLKIGYKPQLLSSIAVIEYDSGRVRLKKRFIPDGQLVKEKRYGPEWDLSKMWITGRCHNRGDFWILFKDFVRENVKEAEENMTTFEETVSSLPEPIYALSERELKKFFESIIGGTYTVIFHATLTDRINEVLDYMKRHYPVKMAAIESCEISPCCDNVGYKAKLYNLSFGLQFEVNRVISEFFIYNDANRHGIMTLKTKYSGVPAGQLLGELAGILAAKLSESGTSKN